MKNLQKIVLLLALAFCATAGDSQTSKARKTDVKEIIYVVPTLQFPPDLVVKMQREIEGFYQVKTKILPSTSFPKKCMSPIQGRYNANKILDFIQQKYGAKKAKVLILTNLDICTDRKLNGKIYPNYRIFGLGLRPGNACVVSSSRFGNNKLQKKLAYVVLHELGHNYGLEHCFTPHCMMKDAQGKGANIENEPKAFCSKCKKGLKS